jgi:hypothetical protein
MAVAHNYVLAIPHKIDEQTGEAGEHFTQHQLGGNALGD